MDPIETWFITGVSSGFGRALTEALLESGHRVAGTVRRRGALTDLAEKHGDRLWLTHLEVTDRDEIVDVVGRVFAEMGSVDVLVNNAGYGLFGAAEEVSDAEIVEQLDTNLLGSIRVIRAALPHLRHQGRGRILQMSSVAGQTASPGASVYHASKWGIEGFIEALAAEVAPFGIGVTLVEPGGARTAFQGASLRVGAPMAAYDRTPAAMVREIRDPRFAPAGDPVKMAAAIIGSARTSPALRRLVLGRSSWDGMHTSLTARLEDVTRQQDAAYALEG